MNGDHLEEILHIAETKGLRPDDLISEYTFEAIRAGHKNYEVQAKDYNVAMELMSNKYRDKK